MTKTVFLRVLEVEPEAKAEALRTAIASPDVAATQQQRFEVDVATFAAVPKSPFAYWVSDRLRGLFAALPPFEAEGRTAKVGLQTSDDFRFVRACWEVPEARIGSRWFPFAKGGKFSPFYADVPMVVDWGNDGELAKAWASSLYGNSHWSRILKNVEFLFRPGLTWPLRGVQFSAQAVPAGCAFSVAGKMAFAELDHLPTLHAVMNSSVFAALIRVQSDAVRIQFEVGLVQGTRVPAVPDNRAAVIREVARTSWSLKRTLDSRAETSHAFQLPSLLQVTGGTLVVRATAWTERVQHAERQLAELQAAIDTQCMELYGIGVDDLPQPAGIDEPDDPAEPDDDADDAAKDDACALTAELVSWAVGVAFGRFDVRLATGARPAPAEPDPFDPLPRCSPGMLAGPEDLPASEPPAGYALSFPEDGILVDDPGHPLDLTAKIHSVFEVVFGSQGEDRWQEAGQILDDRAHSVRAWLGRTFFEHHLRRYSKSRRKAPILWQLATPSASYSVWLYAPRLTADALFRVGDEIVAPKLAHEERKRQDLADAVGADPSAAQRRELSALDDLIGELRGMLDEIRRVAPMWRPDLDDGVLLTMAPLWRLVPQHRAWQRELKAAWDALCAGRYDWARIAMHLWPARVVAKCAEDRSLAIAHGLDEVFWCEAKEDRWQRRPKPTRPLDDLVGERASAAVQAAVASLHSAPVAISGGRRQGRPRARRARGGRT